MISLTTQNRFREFLDRGEHPFDYERTLIERHYQRVLEIFRGGSPPPYELEIQPSPVCNLGCSFCFGREYKRLPNRIGKLELDKLANDIKSFESSSEFKIETIKFCGSTGEPLVNPFTSYGIELFSDSGKKIRLFTNGMLLQEDNYAGRLNLESILKVDILNLSLDAGCDETLKRVKGKNADYNTIMRGLSKLVELRNGRKKPLITVSYVVSEDNYEDIESTTRNVRDYGVDIIRFKIDLTGGDEIKKLSNKLIQRLRRAKEYARDNFVVSSIYSEEEIRGERPEIFKASGNRMCYTSFLWSCVGADFQLYACGHCCHAFAKPYGSLYENSFEDLWKSKYAEEIRKCSANERGCVLCSPFSFYTNEFMSFLAELSNKEREELLRGVKNV